MDPTELEGAVELAPPAKDVPEELASAIVDALDSNVDLTDVELLAESAYLDKLVYLDSVLELVPHNVFVIMAQ